MLTGFSGKLYFDGYKVTKEEASSIRRDLEEVFGREGEVYAFDELVLGVIPLGKEQSSTGETYIYERKCFAFTSNGTIYNRKELIEKLNLAKESSDMELMNIAWRTFGHDAVNILEGDYMFVNYDIKQRKLVLVRAWGNTALYYYIGKNFIAFATHPLLIVAMAGVSKEPNTTAIARIMCRRPALPFETCWKNVMKLEPSEWLEVDKGVLTKKIWWRPSDIIKSTHLKFDAAVEEFLSLYENAIKKRIPSTGKVAATLSGGLDSASVCALAAKELNKSGRLLYAYTSIPFYKEEAYSYSNYITDESIWSQMVANSYSNITHQLVRAAEENIIKCIQLQLARTGEPQAAVANLYWINNIMKEAMKTDCSVMLIGQRGNSTVSYTPSEISMFPKNRFFEDTEWRRYIGYLKWKLQYRIRTIKNARENDIMKCPVLKQDYLNSKAFKQNILNINQKRGDKSHSKLAEAHMGGFDIWYHIGCWSGIEVRDPTMDVKLMEFLLKLPDHMFFSDGEDRRMIRHGMEGILPDELRRNKRRGQQAGDIIPRLRKYSFETDKALEYISASQLALELLDIDEIRRVHSRIKQGETNFKMMQDSLVILLPGISAGLFLASQDTPYKINREL